MGVVRCKYGVLREKRTTVFTRQATFQALGEKVTVFCHGMEKVARVVRLPSEGSEVKEFAGREEKPVSVTPKILSFISYTPFVCRLRRERGSSESLRWALHQRTGQPGRKTSGEVHSREDSRL
ncbi:hypothetical protein TNCT_112561 [Trichonephila clavata]|uniref:Uncharacterized protein n=1 Tax=Trichonephila clavata TaxID=2740835 RepID=A0A8X6FIT2_TRICU|nr:hypothetical protein TNCT_112561 [Trichonephila clavata]